MLESQGLDSSLLVAAAVVVQKESVMAEPNTVRERWAALPPRLEELRHTADEANLLPRGELLDRLAWIAEMCENELLALAASDLGIDTLSAPSSRSGESVAEAGLLRQVLAVHSGQLAAFVEELAEARRLFASDDPAGKLAVRRALYGLHAATSVYVRVQLDVVLPRLESSLRR
ncbi:hypothetical protein GCM10027569_41740 [Flindersiella endophytica]